MPTQDDFILIGSFNRPEEAHIVAAKLESEGISTFIANENTIGMNFLWSQAVGGVQLLINKNDEGAAREILDLPPPPIAEERCPKCGNDQTKYVHGPKMLTTILFFFGLPVPFFKKNWLCLKCQHTWK